MATTASAFEPAPADIRRQNRAITWSVTVHVALAAIVLFTPRSWWTKEPEPKQVMTISLGGSPGPSTTGRTSMGGRTVERQAPPPPRPETTRPTPPAPAAPTAAPPTRTPPRQPPTPRAAPAARPAPPANTNKPQAAAPVAPSRAPVTGPQVQQGSTRVDTNARGQGVGLAAGGGISGGETDLSNFCCPEYVSQMLALIDQRWNKNQQERGTTELRFTIARDGSIDPSTITIVKPSGYGTLDRISRGALQDVRLPRLPAAYPNQTLTVRLSFPYGTL